MVQRSMEGVLCGIHIVFAILIIQDQEYINHRMPKHRRA